MGPSERGLVAGRNVSVAPSRPDYQSAGRAVRPWSGRRSGKAEVFEDGPSCFSFGQHCQDAERAAAGVANEHVQHEEPGRAHVGGPKVELERLTREKRAFGVALCDRGTLDGLAYWPGSEAEYWEELQTTRQTELARYAAVIHLRTPSAGYDHRNPLRIESAEEAAALDARIARAWDGHARRVFVDSAEDFLEKVARAVALVRSELPPCCGAHPIPEIGERSGGADPCAA